VITSGQKDDHDGRVAGYAGSLAVYQPGRMRLCPDTVAGQPGNGSTAQVTGPVQVTGLTNATQVAAGERFSLAVHTVPYLPGSGPTRSPSARLRFGQGNGAAPAAGLVAMSLTCAWAWS
jgi:regulator of chromosome condensation (RCC1) repeat-containing protein